MATQPIEGRFDLGRVLGNSFSVIQRNLVLFLSLAGILVGLPALVVGLAMPRPTGMEALEAGAASPFAQLGPVFWLGTLVVMIGSFILQAAIVRATVDDLNGRQSDFGACLSTGIANLLPLIGITILMSIGIGFGMILLIVPGIILALGWSVSVPVQVEEKAGVTGSMGRSWGLTKGSRWTLLGLFVVLVIISWVFQLVLGGIGGLLGVVGLAVLSAVGQVISSAIFAAGIAAVYVELRQVKEGASPDDLARIFA